MTLSNNQVKVDDVVLHSVLEVLRKHGSVPWTGTMTDLSSALVKVLGKRRSDVLPGSPSALRVVLNRILNRLRTRKVSVKFSRTNDHARTRYVTFTH